MLNCDVSVVGNIATVTISQSSFGVSNGFNLENLMTRLDGMTPNGVIFDVSGLKKIPQATLGGLVEAFIRLDQARLFRPSGMALALCGVPKKTLKQIMENGLDRLLPIFASIPDALADQSFKSMRLRGVRSVVLCASQGARLAPLTGATPVGMLDYLGRPMIARVMEHAGLFGLQDFVLNPGYLGAQISQFAQTQKRASVFCVNEQSWQMALTNDVATLGRLDAAHDVFHEDTFVFQSNILSNVDLIAMMELHRETGADATIAVTPSFRQSACDLDRPKTEESASAILLSPRAAKAFSRPVDAKQNESILSALRAAHMDVQVFVSDHQSASIKCGSDYYACQSQSLDNGAFGVVPVGEQISPKVWVAKDASVGRNVTIEGASFISDGVKLGRGSMLKGCNLVGENCVVQSKSVLSNSILLAQTLVNKNTFVDHMIAAPDWAVSHRFANGSLQNRAPLDGLSWAGSAAKRHNYSAQGVAKIA